ncbi:MAG: hypothetical protein M0R50_08735 [Candidatus Cloacimonetes bacterium]|jgi:hypothetical protein|nr:hypothetical protein [Candidatus Cloacimonadota bacterium]
MREEDDRDKEIDEVPKHKKKAPKKKKYGIEYLRNGFCGNYSTCTWFATEKARDEAMKNFAAKTEKINSRFIIYTSAKKIERK